MFRILYTNKNILKNKVLTENRSNKRKSQRNHKNNRKENLIGSKTLNKRDYKRINVQNANGKDNNKLGSQRISRPKSKWLRDVRGYLTRTGIGKNEGKSEQQKRMKKDYIYQILKQQ